MMVSEEFKTFDVTIPQYWFGLLLQRSAEAGITPDAMLASLVGSAEPYTIPDALEPPLYQLDHFGLATFSIPAGLYRKLVELCSAAGVTVSEGVLGLIFLVRKVSGAE